MLQDDDGNEKISNNKIEHLQENGGNTISHGNNAANGGNTLNLGGNPENCSSTEVNNGGNANCGGSTDGSNTVNQGVNIEHQGDNNDHVGVNIEHVGNPGDSKHLVDSENQDKNSILPEIKVNVNSDASSNDDSFDSKNHFDISSCTEECSVNTSDTKINQETTEESNDESTNEYHHVIPNLINENNNHKDIQSNAGASTEVLIKVVEDNEDTSIDCDDIVKPKKSKRKRWKHYIFGMFICFVITIIGGVYCYYNKPKFIIRL